MDNLISFRNQLSLMTFYYEGHEFHVRCSQSNISDRYVSIVYNYNTTARVEMAKLFL